jgi:hypothetical protein
LIVFVVACRMEPRLAASRAASELAAAELDVPAADDDGNVATAATTGRTMAVPTQTARVSRVLEPRSNGERDGRVSIGGAYRAVRD